MATARATYTFRPPALIKSAELNQNFGDLVSFMNSEVVQKDASLAFTGVPSGPASDPTAANQLCRKAYVDGRAARVLASTTGAVITGSLFNQNGRITGGAGNLISGLTFTMPTVSSPRAVEIGHTCINHVQVFTGTPTHEFFYDIVLDGVTVDRFEHAIETATGPSMHHGPRLVYFLDNTAISAGAHSLNLIAYCTPGTQVESLGLSTIRMWVRVI